MNNKISIILILIGIVLFFLAWILEKYGRKINKDLELLKDYQQTLKIFLDNYFKNILSEEDFTLNCMKILKEGLEVNLQTTIGKTKLSELVILVLALGLRDSDKIKKLIEETTKKYNWIKIKINNKDFQKIMSNAEKTILKEWEIIHEQNNS